MLSSNRSKNLVFAAALLAALGLLAVRRLPRLLFESATYSDGAAHYADLDALRHAVWDAPERLGAAINTPSREGRPALSPDGRWLVFAAGEPGLSCDLWVAEMTGDEPHQARPLTALNTPADELAPAFGAGVLYFASDRTGGRGGYDLWVAPFAEGVVGAAEPVGGGLNTPADELDPAFAREPGGPRLLAFASNRARGGRGDLDLYLAHLDRSAAGVPGEVELERMVALSSAGDDREPAFAATGRALYLASDRDEPGRFAIYRTLREADGWLPPRRVEGLGTGAPRAPAPSADGFTLLFEAAAPLPVEDGRLDRDLYRARSIEVLRRPPPPLGWVDLLLVGLLLTTALLALLAKRWHELDVLYKCFLASLVVHLLMMWLLREVYPEGEVQPLREGQGPTFRVQVLDDSSLAARTRERGGVLEVVAEASPLAPGPTRLETEAAPAGPSEAPPTEIQRAGSGLAAAPSRAADPFERMAPRPAMDEPVVAAPEERFERLEGEAPALALDALATPARQATTGPDRPVAVDLGQLAAEGARRSSAPGEVALQEPRAATGDAPAFSSAGSARFLETVELGPAVSVAAPDERFERLADTPAPEVALPAAAGFDPTGDVAPAAAPSPWEGARELVASAPTAASAPRSGGLEARRAAPEPAPAGAPTTGVARAARGEVLQDAPALALPSERFEPLARGPGSTGESALPAASSFAPARPAAPEVRAPQRWSVPVAAVTPAREPEAAPPIEALAPRPREDVRGLAEPPQRLDQTPYRARFGEQRRVALLDHGGGEDTERAVALGLGYLASIQNADGSWGDPRQRHEKYRQVAIGKTGLALLAFLGAGHTPQGGEHADTVERAVVFLLGSQGQRTGHFGNSSSYSHGIATYALAECFALTHDERLREPLERGVRRILAHQIERGDERLVGGWSYYYPDGAVFDRWPRVSISAWQVMALESARLGGLEVPDASFEAARRFLLGSWDPRLGAFRYSHDPARLRSGYSTLPGSTPAALFALGLLGEDVGSQPFAPARRFTLARAPSGFRYRGDDAFVERAVGNVYFWYYGSLALFRLGGAEWERWNAALKETLLPSQEQDGSWRPLDVYARYAGDDDDDRSYTTAMCVLSLEVYYRYFTPLLQVR